MKIFSLIMSISVALGAFSANANLNDKPKNQLGSADLSTTNYRCETDKQVIKITRMRSQKSYSEDQAVLADLEVISKKSHKTLLQKTDLEMVYNSWAKGTVLADKVSMKTVETSGDAENFENDGDRELAIYDGTSAIDEDGLTGATFILFGKSYRIEDSNNFCQLVD
jgi:hypothetical protein